MDKEVRKKNKFASFFSLRDPPFQPKPSLGPVVEYFSKIIRKWPTEMCPCCGEKSLPEDPKVNTGLRKIQGHKHFFDRHLIVKDNS